MSEKRQRKIGQPEKWANENRLTNFPLAIFPVAVILIFSLPFYSTLPNFTVPQFSGSPIFRCLFFSCPFYRCRFCRESRLLYCCADQWVRLPSWGSSAVNKALKCTVLSMGMEQTNRQTDRQTDGSQHCLMNPLGPYIRRGILGIGLSLSETGQS